MYTYYAKHYMILLCIVIILVYNYFNYIFTVIYIYIYTRNAWVLPRRCSVYMSHSRTNDVANYRNSYGNKNTGTRDYQTNKVKTPEIPMGKTKTA